MDDRDLSERARAILDAAERAATGATSPSGASPPARTPPAPPPPAPAPAGPVAPAPLPVTPPGQVLALVDQVLHAAEGARRRLDELSVTLDELTRRVDAAARATPAAGAPDPTPAGLAAHPLPPPPARAPAPRVGSSSTPAPGEAAARVVAVELAAGGASRMEVDRRLRDDFGLRDTRAILDDLYGVGSSPKARLTEAPPS